MQPLLAPGALASVSRTLHSAAGGACGGSVEGNFAVNVLSKIPRPKTLQCLQFPPRPPIFLSISDSSHLMLTVFCKSVANCYSRAVGRNRAARTVHRARVGVRHAVSLYPASRARRLRAQHITQRCARARRRSVSAPAPLTAISSATCLVPHALAHHLEALRAQESAQSRQRRAFTLRCGRACAPAPP